VNRNDTLAMLSSMRETERGIARDYFRAWLTHGNGEIFHELMVRARAAALRAEEFRALWEVVAEEPQP